MADKLSLTVNQVPIVWDTSVAELSFFGISSVLFWANPSLYNMLAPLVEELGEDLFRLHVASSSSLGTDEDYHAMITALGATFEEGFLAWGKAVGAAGWGVFELPAFDRQSGTARVRVVNPWELRMQRGGGKLWGCPFLQGKVIGIFRHALGRSCWADEEVDLASEVPSVTFSVYPSDKTLDTELMRLREARARRVEEQLAEQVDAATAALLEKGEELREKDKLIRAMSTPILEVWDGVLAVPLMGEVDSERTAVLMGDLLERVGTSSARHTILDLTGVNTVDTHTASYLINLVRAIRLLGSEAVITGIKPSVAQTIVSLGVDLSAIPTRSNLRSGLQYCMKQTGKRAGAAGR